MAIKSYPSDVSDEEWAFVAPYLTLMKEDAPQRQHDLRQVFNALRWMVRSGSSWRFLPPPKGHPTYRAGTLCISKHNAGSRQAASRRWCMICVWRCACSTSAVPRPAPPSWTAAPCLQHPKAASEPATTATRRQMEAKFMWLLTSAQRAPGPSARAQSHTG